MAKILVVDDEMGIRELLSEILDDEGYEVLTAENAKAARLHYQNHEFALILLDIWMPDVDGLTLLKEWVNDGGLTCPIVMMSGHATIETAVEATGLGAIDFLEKPITMHRLLAAVHKALTRGIPLIKHSSADSVSSAHVPALEQAPHHHATQPISTSKLPQVAQQAADQSNAAQSNSAAASQLELTVWQEKLIDINLHVTLKELRDQVERIYFLYLLEKEQGAVTRVAELCGLERTHLYRKLKTLQIEIGRPHKPVD